MIELSRGTSTEHPPLLAPLLWSIACQVEALEPAEFTSEPTKLTRGLTEMTRALELDTIVSACPSGMEAEALGARVDRSTWPPRVVDAGRADLAAVEDFDALWSRSAALSAALETTRRLAVLDRNKSVILAALSGPGALQNELTAPGESPPDYDNLGRALAALARRYAESGATVLLLSEPALPADMVAWNGALRTVANVAKFHRIPLLLCFEDEVAPHEWPGFVVPCPAAGTALETGRLYGVALKTEPDSWTAELAKAPGARIAITRREVSPAIPIGALQAVLAAVRSSEGAAA
jgi:hypothetical protein